MGEAPDPFGEVDPGSGDSEWGPWVSPEPDDLFIESDDYEVRFDDEPRVPRRLDEWRKRTATGALASAVALGLQQVFDPEKKTTIPMEQVVPDEPIDPGRIQLNFDPLDSRGSQVVINLPEED